MTDDRLITVAIHTFDKAAALKAMLEHEGVEVVLQNVNLEAPVVSSGVRVRIHESDLPLALRIIENPEIFVVDSAESGNKPRIDVEHTILLPVDFTDRSLHSAKVAFSIAARTRARVVILHAYLIPQSSSLMSLSNSLTFDAVGLSQPDESESSIEIARNAREMMSELTSTIKSEIKSGNMPGAKFSCVLLEGVPEECIARYIKDNRSVRLIVMGTRAAERKAHDLTGSITAEVLDSCRIQALTVPDVDRRFNSLGDVRTVALLSGLEQEDFLALDALNRLMPPEKALEVKVICLPTHKYLRATTDAARTALREYCRNHFPYYKFTIESIDGQIETIEHENIDLIVVPNRKKNMLVRLFNPGLAHRILFHSDIPMMVIPV